MKKLWNHAIEIAKTISKKFDNPITLEFENAIYFKFLILTKKDTCIILAERMEMF